MNIPPEESVNYEMGGRWESASGDFSGRAAIFKSTKLHERNTDPLTNLVTLSGKRHATGAEFDVAGRLSAQWEVYLSYMWLPDAKIDVGVPGSEGEGTRPSLTPRHSGTVWTTYQLTPQLRVGGGLNALRTGAGGGVLQLGQNTLQMLSGAVAKFDLALGQGLGQRATALVSMGTQSGTPWKTSSSVGRSAT